jgi:hypothetical protein
MDFVLASAFSQLRRDPSHLTSEMTHLSRWYRGRAVRSKRTLREDRFFAHVCRREPGVPPNAASRACPDVAGASVAIFAYWNFISSVGLLSLEAWRHQSSLGAGLSFIEIHRSISPKTMPVHGESSGSRLQKCGKEGGPAAPRLTLEAISRHSAVLQAGSARGGENRADT